MEEEKMDNISTLENEIDEKIRRINDFIVANIPTKVIREDDGTEDQENLSKLTLENLELKKQLTLLKSNHEKDLQDLSEVISQLKMLMEEAND